MTINDFSVQIATAFPDMHKLDTAKGRTYLGEIMGNTRVTAYIKMLNFADITKEALCAVLARQLGLPVPQPYYVSVDVSFTNSGASNTAGIGFGLEEENAHLPRITDPERIRRDIQLWSDVLNCATFDAWIANRDRLPKNVIYNGQRDGFWMIDHDEALPSYLSSSAHANTELFKLLGENKSEIELYQIRNKALDFSDRFNAIDWRDIRKLMREQEFPEMPQYLDAYIKNLQERAVHMTDILNGELNIRQKPLNFGNSNTDTKQK